MPQYQGTHSYHPPDLEENHVLLEVEDVNRTPTIRSIDHSSSQQRG
jgi:hypothetical protein